MRGNWQLLCLAIVALMGCAYAQQIAGTIFQDQAPPKNTVLIQDISFKPGSLTVPAGTTVTWINRDFVRHTVTSDDGLFDSGYLRSGASFNYTFDTKGTYSYHCTIHPIMHGTIIVTEPQQPLARPQPTTAQPPAVQQPPAVEQPSISQQPLVAQQPFVAQQPPVVQQQLVIVPQEPLPSENFSQFYRSEPEPAAPEKLSVVESNAVSMEPQEVYFGGPENQAVSYPEYQAIATTTEPNALWIQGRDTWARYAQVPRGSGLTLVGLTSGPGYATMYHIYPGGTLDQNSLFFYPFSLISFYANDIGQHMFFFVKDNQPSNVVIVDVQPFAPPSPSLYNRAKINIYSNYLTGYDVYVDDVYQFTEGAGGIPDGFSSFTVSGDAVHKITIRSGGFAYTASRFFNSGQTYNINLT